MSEVSIYHNPRCSKSRQTLQLLEQRDIQPKVIDYLNNPLAADELKDLLHKLGFISARELMRSKETIYKEMNLASVTDEEALLDAMAAHPKLMERPVVVCNGRARLGRPPEAVLDILP
ncbi:arsenate reductase [Pseudidiomarina salinarum]|uniref:Arsenate reductase n=1 Tax=Pseudidiomarina salinarum TaxID=435908 RepID=A0A094JHK3_9GAMM|nr:arsenate reductase (glutaredoxin) [Pseudidiomarina salinarum]KFZ32031.1 arsenate reductase [Pseudidiomarina salinarum]RUO70189.1 arsenate reductase (glutaredoxin) [Pseudidiomarina salinarum]